MQQRTALARHRALALDGEHVEGDVRPVEARAHRHRVAQPEALRDLARDARRRRRGRRHHRRTPEVGDRVVEAQVVRAEVVPPLGHAVRLVDHEQRDPPPRQGPAKAEEANRSGAASTSCASPRADLAQRALVRLLRQTRGEHHRPHAGLEHAPQLVGHERDERTDDDDEAAIGERRQLIAERLAAAGRHHDEAVAAGQGGLHRLALAGAEGIEAETRQQVVGRRRRIRRRRIDDHPRAGVTERPGALARGRRVDVVAPRRRGARSGERIRLPHSSPFGAAGGGAASSSRRSAAAGSVSAARPSGSSPPQRSRACASAPRARAWARPSSGDACSAAAAVSIVCRSACTPAT